MSLSPWEQTKQKKEEKFMYVAFTATSGPKCNISMNMNDCVWTPEEWAF